VSVELGDLLGEREPAASQAGESKLGCTEGRDVSLLRIRAALVIRSRSFRPMSLARSSSGAVSITEWTCQECDNHRDQTNS
jgi:hypothetical protein